MADLAPNPLGHPLAAGSVRFGTDGIRGRVGTVITPALALQLGYWCGRVLPPQGPILLGCDSRSSGPMLLELANIFNRDTEHGIKRGLTLLEPALILILGTLIAAIIVSILMGILAVNDLAL